MKETYADLKQKLEDIIDKLQSPQTDLDEALKLHTEGAGLIEKLEKYLNEVQAKTKTKGQ